jgi:hypothetical protein
VLICLDMLINVAYNIRENCELLTNKVVEKILSLDRLIASIREIEFDSGNRIESNRKSWQFDF